MSALTGGSKKSKVLEFKVPKEKKVDKASLEKVKKARAAAQSKLTVTETVKYAGQTIQYVRLFCIAACTAEAAFAFFILQGQ